MLDLKTSSIPTPQEIQIEKACQIIEERTKEHLAKNRKSYVIDSRFFGDDEPEELGFLLNRPFGRG